MEKMIGSPSFLAKTSQSDTKTVFVAKSPLEVEKEAATRTTITKATSTALDGATDTTRKIEEGSR